ncbi:GREB1-like protein [Desmophyllum pertusum]|uniref:GREB1-like protein n=1 Tax=Desmophyllum pertusum TaxID=174260 RepID=A0A9W9ZI66_9CNID|nr:GREB1-like protein [Desmophyllum pertusum]
MALRKLTNVLDTFVDDEYSSDEEEEIDKEVQANPEKPCYYPAQIEMAAILKKRIDTIMSYYHNIPRLSDVFNDVEFVVYTARYRMLSDQTEKRICHPDAGVLSREELESRDDCNGKKRMFMYVRSQETETHFEELKNDVQEKPKTLFVIIADECHWGITKDKEKKPSAHNLFINEWCKDNSPKNAFVVQISATPFNLLTQNSRLPLVKCVLLNDKVSTTLNDYEAGDLVVLEREPNLEEHVRKNSKEVELHVVHWSEVELKNFETGIRMKLKSALRIEDAPYQYLHISSNGKLGVTSSEHHATDFIVQGSHGIVILKVLATNEQQRAKPLTINTDAQGNLEATVAPHDQQPTKFEVKLDSGVGVVAFGSCENPDLYIAVDEHGRVALQAAKVERRCGVCILKPKHDIARVAFEFYIDQSGPVEVDLVGETVHEFKLLPKHHYFF